VSEPECRLVEAPVQGLNPESCTACNQGSSAPAAVTLFPAGALFPAFFT
jgi:hypothetical protein